MRTLPRKLMGRVCKSLRSLAGWEQIHLSKSANISVTTIRNVEHATRQTNLSTILSIQESFTKNGMSVEYDEQKREVLIRYKY